MLLYVCVVQYSYTQYGSESVSIYTGENRRFDHRIVDSTSWVASEETSLEVKVLVVFKRSKYINIS